MSLCCNSKYQKFFLFTISAWVQEKDRTIWKKGDTYSEFATSIFQGRKFILMFFPEFSFFRKCGFIKPRIIYIYVMTWTESRGKAEKIHNSSLRTALYHAEACFQQFFRLRCTGRPPLQTWFSFLSPILLSFQAVVRHLMAVVRIVQPCRLKGFSLLFTFKWMSVKRCFYKEMI